MNYSDHKDTPKSFRALTGLGHPQFSHLLEYFEAVHDDYLSEYELNGNRRSRRRSFCIYKTSPLPNVPECLFFILVYLKNNPLQEYHAACFGMDQEHCNIFVHCLSHILRLSLEAMGLVPAQTDKELSARLSELSKNGLSSLYCSMTGLKEKFLVLLIPINRKNNTVEKRNGIP